MLPADSGKRSLMKNKAKQIAAWICILVLFTLYIATFVVSLLDFPGSDALFRACLAATVCLPILLWIYIWLYGKIKDRHTMASFDLFQTRPEDQKKDRKQDEKK